MNDISLVQFATVIISLLLAYVGKHNNNNRQNPMFLFNIEWSLILGLALFNTLGFNTISEYTAFIILLGVIGFNLGIFCGTKIIGNAYDYNVIDLERFIQMPANRLIVEVIFIFPPIYLATKMMKVLPMLQSGLSYGYIRVQYWTTKTIVTSGFDYFLNNTVCKACELVLVTYLLLEIFQRRVKIHHLLLAICTIALEVFIAGGRMILLETIFAIAIIFSISGISYDIPEIFRRRIKKILYVIILLAIFGIVFMTGDRQSEMSVAGAVLSNFTLCLPLMDHLIDIVHTTGDMTYGFVFFRGIFEIICTFTGPLGIFNFPTILSQLDKYTNPFYSISNSQTANAYTSMFFDFYLDFGLLGVVMESLIFGFIIQRIYLRMREYPSDKNIIMYIIFAKAILYSFFQWRFMMGSYVLAVIITVFMYIPMKRS